MKRSEVLKLRKIIEEAVQFLADATELQAVTLHPTWAENIAYDVGYKVQRNGKLYKSRQEHTSQVGWEPELSTSLWEVINETHSGTLENPIPYDGNMALEQGKYYIQKGIIYRCTRDTVSPVYNTLSELVNIYVEEIK